jgi:hypothetical protein
LEVPNKYGTYTIDLLIDDEPQQAFDQIWKSGRVNAREDFFKPAKLRVDSQSRGFRDKGEGLFVLVQSIC